MYILFSATPPEDCLHEINYSNSGFFCPVITCSIKDKIFTIAQSVNNDLIFFFLSFHGLHCLVNASCKTGKTSSHNVFFFFLRLL